LLVYVEQYVPDDTEETRADTEAAFKCDAILPSEVRDTLTFLEPSDTPLLSQSEKEVLDQVAKAVTACEYGLDAARAILENSVPSLSKAQIANFVNALKPGTPKETLFWSVNERRKRDGLPSVPGGDVVMVPTNLTPLQSVNTAKS
jgi:hypothetical protein